MSDDPHSSARAFFRSLFHFIGGAIVLWFGGGGLLEMFVAHANPEAQNADTVFIGAVGQICISVFVGGVVWKLGDLIRR